MDMERLLTLTSEFLLKIRWHGDMCMMTGSACISDTRERCEAKETCVLLALIYILI